MENLSWVKNISGKRALSGKLLRRQQGLLRCIYLVGGLKVIFLSFQIFARHLCRFVYYLVELAISLMVNYGDVVVV